MKGDKLELQLAARVPVSVHRAFSKKAKGHGGISRVLRELIEAWVDGRTTIAPPKDPFYSGSQQ
jgi:hypothetical protein